MKQEARTFRQILVSHPHSTRFFLERKFFSYPFQLFAPAPEHVRMANWHTDMVTEAMKEHRLTAVELLEQWLMQQDNDLNRK